MSEGVLVITGVEGFVGSHVARLAAARGFTVVGIGRSGSPSDEVMGVLEAYHRMDLREDVVLGIPQPQAVVHLAAYASVGESFARPKAYLADNSAMTISVGEWMLASGWTGTRLVVVSTGAVYSARSAPITESDAVDPSSPYVVSKLASEKLAGYYARRGLDTVTMRPFNHIGPGQGLGFLVPDLVQKVEQARESGVLATGNLATRRDYSDVRDVADAYLRVATAPSLRRRLYNVGSGVSWSGEQILDIVSAQLGVDRASVRTDQAKSRPIDVPEIVADATALRHDLGWCPALTVEESIRDYIRARG